MQAIALRNLLVEHLRAGRFVAAIEFVTPASSEPLDMALAPILDLARRSAEDPRVHAIAVTDRVKSDEDHDPVTVAARVAAAAGKTPTVHLSGKDRTPADLADAFARMSAAGLTNVLLVTGDRVKHEPGDRRVRYHDSVDMIVQARAIPGAWTIAAAVSPFKYREEEAMNQYFKMVKKERAGADYFITQVGWDMLKLKELAAYRYRRGLGAPVLAGVMLLTVARARYIRANRLAGVTVTDDLHGLLEAEAALPDKGIERAYARLALQIVGLKHLGYAGFQLTGLHAYDKLDRLLRWVEELERELRSEADWWDAWWAALRGPTGQAVETAPKPVYLFEELAVPGGCNVPAPLMTPVAFEAPPAPTADFRKFRRLDRVDAVLFEERSLGAALLTPLARLVSHGSAAEQALHWAERRIKAPVVGCETCGFCRLPYTSYVCPETCPKGLANGPCGGTSDNECEFGDRECIHNRKYRIAKEAGRLHELEDLVIPPVPAAARGTCSWVNHFRGEDPVVMRLTARGRKDGA